MSTYIRDVKEALLWAQGSYKDLQQAKAMLNLSDIQETTDICTNTRVIMGSSTKPDGSPGPVFVAARGTSSVQEAITDLNAAKVDHDLGGKVHHGFQFAAQQVEEDILDDVQGYLQRSDRQVIVTGHSLGGALAILLALRIKTYMHDRRIKVRVFTFGAPHVGNNTFRSIAERELDSIVRTNIRTDPVPRMFDMLNSAQQRWMSGTESEAEIPDEEEHYVAVGVQIIIDDAGEYAMKVGSFLWGLANAYLGGGDDVNSRMSPMDIVRTRAADLNTHSGHV